MSWHYPDPKIQEQHPLRFSSWLSCEVLYLALMLPPPAVNLKRSFPPMPVAEPPSLRPAELEPAMPVRLFAFVLLIPGKLVAKFLNNYLTLTPVFALVSMNCRSSSANSFAKLTPSSRLTCLFSSSSSLFPTITILTSSPRCVLASWIHLGTFSKDWRARGKG